MLVKHPAQIVFEREFNLLSREPLKMNARDRQFFQPLWRRLVIIPALAIWTLVEWWNGNSLWGTLTTGALVYCLWLSAAHFRKSDGKSQNDH
jgi:hypothetical protein